MSGKAGAVRAVLLVVGSGYQLGHERLLSQMAAEADLVLLNAEPVSWQSRWVRDSAVFDPRDEREALRLAKSLAAEHRISAVVSFEEPRVLLAAQIADELGLPGVPLAAAKLTRDKYQQRELLQRTGISPTRSLLAHDQAAAREAAREIGYPLVVKPRGLSGSVGVRRVDDEAELDGAIDNALYVDKKGMFSDGILIEEFLSGFEFDVDCWIADGVATPVSWGRKIWAYDPYPMEAGGIIGNGSVSPQVMSEGFDLACRGVLATGLDRTIAHVEAKMTPKGPRIIEINPRPGGDLRSRVIEMGRGVQLGAMLASAALGRPLEMRSFDDRSAGIRFLYPRGRQIFDGLAEVPELRGRPWLLDVQELRPRGVQAVPPPEDPWGRVGFVIATGSDAEEVSDRLLLAHHELRPLGPLCDENGSTGDGDSPA